ncbi:MAG: chorismate synthase [Oscillospiraceae bacterium]|nr:chorismate synthase [Oscillospiraceae bacterium]
MASIIGKNIKVQIFGQSHSAAIGAVIDGLPAGIAIDTDALRGFMSRRAPGRTETATPRKEADEVEFLSGFSQPAECSPIIYTCGAPIAAIIRNTNTRSGDYSELRDVPRPGHADYTAQIKYGEFHDIAGGGHFSGRLTAPLCIAGGICKQILDKLGVEITARIISIGAETNPANFEQTILAAKAEGDSVGGVIECVASGVPAGIGEPMFDGVENRIAQIVFGIPAVKGLEFGSGFAGAALRGSQNNDEYVMDGESVAFCSNNAGGILGGITTGADIVFRVAVKPTPSIAREQCSVSLSRLENTPLSVRGRHDPCIVPRAVPCVEAAASIAIYDMYLEGKTS